MTEPWSILLNTIALACGAFVIGKLADKSSRTFVLFGRSIRKGFLYLGYVVIVLGVVAIETSIKVSQWESNLIKP
jgi:hypothetical protein